MITDKERKSEYKAAKRAALVAEKTNNSRLILFGSGNDWWKMGGNSLLIYAYYVCPKLHLTPNIVADTDYGKEIFEDGVISFRSLDKLENALTELKLLAGPRKVLGAKAVFELNKKFTAKELASYLASRHEEDEKAYSLVRPTIIIRPMVGGRIRTVLGNIHFGVKNMQGFDRDTYGADILRPCIDMEYVYLAMNKNQISESEGWPQILRDIEEIQLRLSIAVELKIIKKNYILESWADLVDLRKEVKTIIEAPADVS